MPQTDPDRYRTQEATPLELSWRHAHWHARRAKVLQALTDAGASPRRIERFANCGAACYILKNTKTGEHRCTCQTCRDRLCQPCAAARGRKVARAIEAKIVESQGRDHGRSNATRCLMVLLTLKSTDQPIQQQIDRIYRCYAALRRRKKIKKILRGGAAVFEITRNPDTHLYHPHLHCVWHAAWIDLKTLQAEWLAVTGDSDYVGVSAVRGADSAARELTKYISKPLHRSVDYSPEALAQVITGLHSRRLCLTHGTWRGIDLLAPDPDYEPSEWIGVGSLHSFLARAAAGDLYASEVLRHLYRGATWDPNAQVRIPAPAA